jgi:hypothetical protein
MRARMDVLARFGATAEAGRRRARAQDSTTATARVKRKRKRGGEYKGKVEHEEGGLAARLSFMATCQDRDWRFRCEPADASAGRRVRPCLPRRRQPALPGAPDDGSDRRTNRAAARKGVPRSQREVRVHDGAPPGSGAFHLPEARAIGARQWHARNSWAPCSLPYGDGRPSARQIRSPSAGPLLVRE